jgi:MerR family transcriptional regulator, thiopeptide resistance regulator
MLHVKAVGWGPTVLDKELLVALFRDAGLDDEGMDRWHREFEHRAPRAHQEFLRALVIAEDDIARIRARSRRVHS